ncbi:unannotated protein [freshwater metagenome]|uniref:Unannotated protein n=1 Tax=freshwater metagenome TaxID=449393 RepID=A0A6J6FD20_9ZZZZ
MDALVDVIHSNFFLFAALKREPTAFPVPLSVTPTKPNAPNGSAAEALSPIPTEGIPAAETRDSAFPIFAPSDATITPPISEPSAMSRNFLRASVADVGVVITIL